MELGEVGPPALEKGKTLSVEEVRPPTPPPQADQDKVEEPVLVVTGRGRGQGKGKAAPKAPKKDWSLDAAIEEDILEWLKGNPYLWMRSKKGYKQKRAAWDMKALELGINVEHLEQWWKGIKDWYVKLSKKTSGQATKMLTERENWVLQHFGFYKGRYNFSYIDFKVSRISWHLSISFDIPMYERLLHVQTKCQCHITK